MTINKRLHKERKELRLRDKPIKKKSLSVMGAQKEPSENLVMS